MTRPERTNYKKWNRRSGFSLKCRREELEIEGREGPTADGGTFVAALKAEYANIILNKLCRLSVGKTRVIPTLGK